MLLLYAREGHEFKYECPNAWYSSLISCHNRFIWGYRIAHVLGVLYICCLYAPRETYVVLHHASPSDVSVEARDQPFRFTIKNNSGAKALQKEAAKAPTEASPQSEQEARYAHVQDTLPADEGQQGKKKSVKRNFNYTLSCTST